MGPLMSCDTCGAEIRGWPECRLHHCILPALLSKRLASHDFFVHAVPASVVVTSARHGNSGGDRSQQARTVCVPFGSSPRPAQLLAEKRKRRQGRTPHQRPTI